MTTQEVVQFKDVSIAFHGNIIHENINFLISKGESLTFLGPSGTGKTVLLKLIIGLLRPTSGSVHVLGTDVGNASEEELQAMRRNVGFLFQGAALFDSLSVFENVAYSLRERGVDDETYVREKVNEKLTLVGLEAKASQFPAELSGGQKKRVGLARALASEPTLMLFDEPTTGLDPTSGRMIDELIIRLNNELGITTLSVTHDIMSARRISSRWILLADNSIIADGHVEQLESQNEFVRDFVSGRWGTEL